MAFGLKYQDEKMRMKFFHMILFRIRRMLNRRKGLNTYTNQSPEYQNFDIGDFTYGFPSVRVFSKHAQLKIGRYCSIAQGVKILLGGHHNTDSITTYPFKSNVDGATQTNDERDKKLSVEMGSDVWIGENVLILSGVKIGHGVAIGAGAVVTKELPPYSICVGVPCKPIKFRFDDETISKLLEIEWWNWPHDEVEEIKSVLLGNDCEVLLEFALKRKYHAH